MRTTLAIDDDVLAAAKNLAERERRTMGEVISSLARLGLHSGQPKSPLIRHGVPLLPAKSPAEAVTLELVNRLRDDAV